MTKLILSWAILRLIWESKGYSTKEMTDLLKSQFPDRPGFALSSLQRKTEDGQKAPGDVARFVMDAEKLPVRKGNEHSAEVVQLVVSALLGKSTPDRQPPELALSMLAHFPTDALALKLADALARQAGLSPGTGFTLAKLTSRIARLVAERLGVTPASAKLDTLQLELNHTGAMVGVIAAKLDTGEVQRRKDKRHILAAIWGTGLTVIACMFAMHCQHAPTPAPVQQVTITVGTGQGVAEVSAKCRPGTWGEALDPDGISGDMGKRKPPDPVMMPHEGLPEQRGAPCPGSSEALYGVCWYLTGHKPPCPQDQFQEGQACYVPVHSKPKAPASETTRPPNPEQH